MTSGTETLKILAWFGSKTWALESDLKKMHMSEYFFFYWNCTYLCLKEVSWVESQNADTKSISPRFVRISMQIDAP